MMRGAEQVLYLDLEKGKGIDTRRRLSQSSAVGDASAFKNGRH
jgi:hypothetical protein